MSRADTCFFEHVVTRAVVLFLETEKASLLEHVLLFRDQSIPDPSDYDIQKKAL